MYTKLSYLVCFVLALGVTAGVVNGGGLWGRYPINENDFNDYSGNSHHGTVIDGAATVLDTDRGWVAAFNIQPALPSRIICGTDDPSADGEVSVSAWIKWEGMNGNWQAVAGKSYDYYDRRWIFQLRDTDGMIQWGGSDQDNLHIFSTVAPRIGEWQHVAGSCDGSYSKVYINGQIVGEGPGGFRPDAAIGANVTFGFGEDRDDYDESFNGVIDEIYIYSLTLSDQDVTSLALGIAPVFPKSDNDYPKDGAVDVPQDITLKWRPGTNAVTHDVYFGKVFDDINEASRNNPLDVLLSEGQEGLTYDIPDLLEYGQTYYWRVDEVNDVEPNSPWKGDIWSFEVLNFPVVIDDFEDYNDYPPDEVWSTWIDGFGDATNGSTAGYPNPDFNVDEHYVETVIVHTGMQSMPLFYDNTAGLSEVTRTLSGSVTDWTQQGVVTLTLFYYGNADNTAEPLYVAVNGSAVVTNDDINAVLVTEWTRWDIPLSEFADQGVNLGNVSSMSIGFGNKANPTSGGSGHVFFDDIRLYR